MNPLFWMYLLGVVGMWCALWLMWREMKAAQNEARYYRADRDSRQALVLRWVVEDAAHKHMSRRTQAEALRTAAKEYDSASGKHRLAIVARSAEQGGPSVPALWLLATADLIDPPVEADHSDHDHNYAGDCLR